MDKQAFRAFLVNAQTQTNFTARTPAGFVEPTAYFSKPAAVTGTLNLTDAPIATPGGETMKMAAAVLQASRVAAAGAHIIVRPDPDRARAVGPTGDIALERIARYFSTIEAAPFATVADDEDVNASALPVSRAEIAWSNAPQSAVRFEVKRRDLTNIGNDVFVDEILLSLVLGLARAADASLLTAINAANPAAFTLAAAAAKGLKYTELHGLVGTAGDGAAIRQDGALTAAGIGAELTGDMAATLVGAWNRAAVAIHEDVAVAAERRNLQGDLIVTAYANIIPLVPDAGMFWTVGA